MESTNFDFWKMAFDMKAIGADLLRQAVVCKMNPYGEITPIEFTEISKEEFEKNEDHQIIKPVEVQPTIKLTI